MRAGRDRRIQGFTLIELMIVVAIIGILASVAVPSFINYQLKAKRAEAFANLNGLVKAQKGYFAEFNTYLSVAAEPGATLGTLPSSVKRDVAPLTAAFAPIGFTADGDVFFEYDTIDGITGSCGCQTCFTATAYGDLDEDGWASEIVFFHPDAAGLTCPVVGSGKTPPIDPTTLVPQLDVVVWHFLSDKF